MKGKYATATWLTITRNGIHHYEREIRNSDLAYTHFPAVDAMFPALGIIELIALFSNHTYSSSHSMTFYFFTCSEEDKYPSCIHYRTATFLATANSFTSLITFKTTMFLDYMQSLFNSMTVAQARGMVERDEH